MYFSQNKKPAERRANDEYRRRISEARQHPEETPASAALTAQDTPGAEAVESCAPSSDKIVAPSLAMVYSKKQSFQNLYEPEQALAQGTLFADLDLPFEGRRISK